MAYAMCRDRAIAEDAAQACWQAALQHWDEIRDPASLRSWLLTVTANEVRRQLRRRRMGQLLHIQIGARPEPEPDARFVDLARALDSLPARDRQIVALRYSAGMTSDQIGAVVGLSGPGTRRRLQSALSKLRTELSDD
jgi:RNA polymerase sigma-70 factor (ECF subfamily)